MATVVIRGGTVIDGTGGPRRRADVRIEGDRIVAVTEPGTPWGGAAIDADGLIVSPGFIDAHTHDDQALVATPELAPKVSQGVTSVIAGNCGISLAPLTLAGEPPAPLDLLGGREVFRYATFADYVRALESAPPAVNAALLVGHSTLRVATMDRTDRPASPREIAAMQTRIGEAMAAGAIGFSTGLDYPPSAAAPTEEVIELAKVARAAGGIYATHMRNYAAGAKAALDEAVAIGKGADVPVVVSHYVCGGLAWPGLCRQSLAWMAEAMREHDVGYDGYPYVGSSTSLLPEYLPHNERIMVSWSKPHPEMAGQTLADVAAAWGCGEEAAAIRLAPAGAVYFARDEGEVREAIATPTMMFGSDGIPLHPRPHPRLWGTFPRVLGHYARDVGLFDLETAVHRMTGMTAKRFGLKDRGVIRVGALADLALWDPATIIDRATYEDPEQPAEGIVAVLVNGRPVWREGRATGERPGRVLRRQV